MFGQQILLTGISIQAIFFYLTIIQGAAIPRNALKLLSSIGWIRHIMKFHLKAQQLLLHQCHGVVLLEVVRVQCFCHFSQLLARGFHC